MALLHDNLILYSLDLLELLSVLYDFFDKTVIFKC